MGAPSRGKSATWIGALASALLTATASAGPTPTTDAPKGLPITLPGGLVIVIGAEPPTKPEAVILSPERYQQLLDRLEKLQAELDARQPVRPRSCELEGRLEQRGQQAVVRLKATFKFTTTQQKAVVHLGCQRAQAVEAAGDDGKPPLLTASDDGLRVQVESAGDHTVRLELDVPVSPRGPKGAELGFELGLPGAPITALAFQPPPNVKRFSLTTRVPRTGPGLGPAAEPEVEVAEAERFAPAKGGAPLGPVTHLALSWDDPQRRGDVARSAEADVTVTVSVDEIVTEARLRLRGPAGEWQFTAPPTADVTVGLWPATGPGKPPAELPADRAPSVVRPEPGQSVWRMRLPEPAPTDLLVTITSRAARARAGEAAKGPFPVGPFAVLDVPQQSGVVRVRTPFNLRATATLKGQTRRDREAGSGEAVYRFTYPAGLNKPPAEPPLELTVAAVAGVVNARVRHELRLEEGGWRLRMEIAISPNRAEVESVEVEVPPAFHPTQADPRDLVEGLGVARDTGGGRRVYRVVLASPKRSSFAFTMEGEYPMPPGHGAASLPLPRLLGVSERAAEVVVSAPTRFDLRGSFRTWDGTKPGTWETPLDPDPSDKEVRISGSADGPIAAADLTWRVGEAGVSVRSVSDLDIEPGRVRVSQRLAYRFGGKPPARLRLKSDRKLTLVRTSRGSIEPAPDGWELIVPGDAGREAEFTLTFAVTLPSEGIPTGGRFVPPVLVPEQRDSLHTVRVWDPSGRRLRLTTEEAWGESAVELVDGRSTLPALVIRATGPVDPPVLAAGAEPADPSVRLSIDKVMIESWLADDSAVCRARFWIRNWDRELELLVPTEATAIEISVQGRRLSAYESGSSGPHSGHFRVSRPAGMIAPGVLEVRYRLPAGQVTELRPPRVVGVEPAEVSWAVSPPPRGVAIVPGNVVGSYSPDALATVLGLARARHSLDGEPGIGVGEPPVVVRTTGAAPVRVYVVPQPAWVLICSSAGFALAFVVRFLPSPLRWPLGVLAVAAVTVGVIVSPQPFAQALFGALPGLAAFAVTTLGFRWARVRYRRKANRVPEFARPGSALVRPSAARPSSVRPREATTLESAPVPNAP
jgi:hypothetical protein